LGVRQAAKMTIDLKAKSYSSEIFGTELNS